MPNVLVRGVPDWVPPGRLLDDGDWNRTEDGWEAHRSAREAADLMARLRKLGMAGRPIEVQVSPRPKRTLIRAARTDEARRKRKTTPGFTRSRARVDEDGRRFLTPEQLALNLARRARRTGRAQQVLDPCAGCGGNAIGFARAGCSVVAIELNPDRLALARHNARVYGVGNQISFIHGDARELVPEIAADLVFLDPPWGEPDRIACHRIPLLDELVQASAHIPRVWAKVPPSFVGRPGFEMEAWFGLEEGDRRRVKFVLLRNDS